MYVCDSCGQESSKWIGRCPSCGQWNTFKELRIKGLKASGRGQSAARGGTWTQDQPSSRPIPLHEIHAEDEPRIAVGDEELARVLGGGLVRGSLTLLGGEPGIGKSTLLMQTVLRLSSLRILYVSGEESARQLKLRADRLLDSPPALPVREGVVTIPEQPSLSVSEVSAPSLTGRAGGESISILCDTSLESITAHVEREQPDLLVIDSIQTIATEANDSAPGSLSQIRECATALLRMAKSGGPTTILVGHITKEGTLAGPKVLEHIVDTVLQFEGDQQHLYRLLRAQKNRFGSTQEVGIYEMRQGGLRPVSNPSELLLGDRSGDLSGVATAVTMEGARPLLIETQALVSTAAYGTAQRSANGFDGRRLAMLLAVLEKRVGFKLAQKDVFLNIAGGLRVTDPATDLAVLSAVLSSNVDTPISPSTCCTGEVGLSGELRPIPHIESRIAEAERLGFTRILIPQANLKSIDPRSYRIELAPCRRVEDAFRELFG